MFPDLPRKVFRHVNICAPEETRLSQDLLFVLEQLKNVLTKIEENKEYTVKHELLKTTTSK